jgi:riboflavin kinase/FMN adenylyltransferase
MEVLRDPGRCPAPTRGNVVTIGAFDGVHLGHRSVIGEVRRMAAARGLGSALVTFDRHPASVVRPESAPKLLCDLEQKLELLAETGLDTTLVVPFDAARAAESAEDFVQDVLVGCLGAKIVVVGEDFHFGNGRRGNVTLLRSMGEDLGFEVDGLALRGVDGAHDDNPVSSTRIRGALVEGALAEANALLGRPHEVRGRVAHGDARGRELGFPTANVEVPEEILLPADGIYAGWYVRPSGVTLPAALSLGRRPTFYDDQLFSLLECHVLGFDGDLYDEQARVRFVARLRGEEKFDTVDALVEQIQRDCADAAAILGAAT